MRRIWLLILGAFTLGLDAYVMAGLLPVVADDLDTTVSMAGQMVTAYTLAYAVSAPLVAGLLSGTRPGVLLVVALAVFTLGNAVTAVSTSVAVLLGSRVIAGAGAGVFSALATAGASALAPEGRQGRALALVMGGMSAGTVLGVPVGVLVAEEAGWRATMWLVTGLGVVALAGLCVRLPRIPASPGVPIRARFGALTDRRVAPVVGVSFLAAVASLGLYTYLAPVLGAAGVDAGGTAPYLWAWGIGGVLGSVVAGPLLDRTGRAAALVTAVLVVLVLAEGALPPLGAAAFPALVLWGAAGWALQVPQQQRLLALRGGDGDATVALALNNSALYLGSAIGSGLGGLALAGGLPAERLPWLAAGVAVLGLGLHLAAGRRAPRGGAPGRGPEGAPGREPEGAPERVSGREPEGSR
ncbi:MFS transporter [Streptomyces sp. NPDC006798]|uniref:MFS transporter n=1 Tax=Streptomyces sp. NPDC006798 TaxID=3155462 RepID=UPI0033EE40F1